MVIVMVIDGDEERKICYFFIFNYKRMLFMEWIDINPLKTKRWQLYLKTQSVPRCKHFSSRL
jgi:hypothetical protein